MPTLYIMVGTAASGKSYWAKQFLKNRTNCHYVSRDAIRFVLLKDNENYFAHEDEVFAKYVNEIQQHLAVGIDVIADATHLSVGSRKKLISALTDKNMPTERYNIIFVRMNTSLGECLRRDAARQGLARVGEGPIRRMYYQTTTPTVDEFPNVLGVWVINE